MDFSVMAPHLRLKLDKILVRLFSDQWRDMRGSREITHRSLGKWNSDIERVRGWSRELENGEKAFLRDLLNARKQIEESAEIAARPSRDLEDYSVSTLNSTSGSKAPSTTSLQAPSTNRPTRSEKQGWLYLRTVTGKPSKTVWVRRWFFVKNGICGWLVQGSRSGGVEESERIGVLLCSVRPAIPEERRFCFEVKTTQLTILVQADTQPELLDWVRTFEIAKQKALEDPASTDSPGLEGPRAQDAAFAISAPSAPEFAASAADSGMQQFSDDNGLDRISTLPVPGGDSSLNLSSRSSFDVSVHRRSTAGEKDGENSRDHTTRMIQRLDLHRKPVSGAQSGVPPSSPALGGGGIASLIAASHNVMPVGPGIAPQSQTPDTPVNRILTANTMRDLPTNSLAPNTLANPPAPTNLSSTAVIVNGEKGIGMDRTDATGGMPSGIMANVWGTSNWGYLNRLERGELKSAQDEYSKVSNPPSPHTRPSSSPSKESSTLNTDDKILSPTGNESPSETFTTYPSHRNAASLEGDVAGLQNSSVVSQEYPACYPLQLKAQDAQFRLLFPNVRRQERVVFVFNATWNLNGQQEFPGRVYATAKEIYFYSNHLGMILTSGVNLGSVSDVTVAPGKDCDFLFLHLKDTDGTNGFTRITIKTFLEPPKLLQRRLNFLVQSSTSNQMHDLEYIVKFLIKLEQEDSMNSPSFESGENVPTSAMFDDISLNSRNASERRYRDVRAAVLVDQGLYGDFDRTDDGKDVTKFKLPRQPVNYVPSGLNKAVVEKVFDVSPKALFHVMFGDRSAVWQLLYHERHAQGRFISNPICHRDAIDGSEGIKQGSWTQLEESHRRRIFEYEIEYLDVLRIYLWYPCPRSVN